MTSAMGKNIAPAPISADATEIQDPSFGLYEEKSFDPSANNLTLKFLRFQKILFWNSNEIETILAIRKIPGLNYEVIVAPDFIELEILYSCRENEDILRSINIDGGDVAVVNQHFVRFYPPEGRIFDAAI